MAAPGSASAGEERSGVLGGVLDGDPPEGGDDPPLGEERETSGMTSVVESAPGWEGLPHLLTHAPKHPECPVCQQGKMTAIPRRRG
eukprot:3193409-Lingulodinium_polyedra.AAC.1